MISLCVTILDLLERYFRHCFRMSEDLFQHIANSVKHHDQYFAHGRSCVGLLGHSTIQKVTAALRMMAYGIPTNLVDNHLAMGESTSIECVKRFAVVVVEVFGLEYLRTPNAQDATRLLESNKAPGFQACPSLSIACTGPGRTVLQLGMDNSKDTRRMPPSFLKGWPIRRIGFGIHFLVSQDLVLTSMSSKYHIYLQCWTMVNHPGGV